MNSKNKSKWYSQTNTYTIFLSIFFYSLCSSSLLLVNKLILHRFPFPSITILVELLTTLFILYSGSFLSLITLEKHNWKLFKPYITYTLLFSLGIYCNMRSLSIANVETIIVFRALAPLVVSLIETVTLNYTLTKSKLISLCILSLGALGYAYTDPQFQSQGLYSYTWPSFYLLLISMDTVYGKKLIQGVEFETISGPVQYTHLLGWFPFLVMSFYNGEFEQFLDIKESSGGWVPLLQSYNSLFYGIFLSGCLIGTMIGYTSWLLRSQVSATSYTLIGVLCKVVTVFVNVCIWENHANWLGIGSLGLSLVGGLSYSLSGVNRKKEANAKKTVKNEVNYSDNGDHQVKEVCMN